MPVNPTPPENYRRTHLVWDGGWMEFDAVLRQTLEHDGEVTEHPIDQGADIVDHYRQFNTPLVLEALITNSPLRAPLTHTGGVSATTAGVDVEIPAPIAFGPITLPDTAFGFDVRARHSVRVEWLDFDPELDRINEVYTTLRVLQSGPTLLSVALGDLQDIRGGGAFDNMILKSISIDRERKGSLPLTLEFRQVAFAELATAEIEVRRPRKVRSNKAKSAGKKAAPAAAPEELESVAHRLLSGGG